MEQYLKDIIGKKFDIIHARDKDKIYKCIKVIGFDYYILKEIKRWTK